MTSETVGRMLAAYLADRDERNANKKLLSYLDLPTVRYESVTLPSDTQQASTFTMPESGTITHLLIFGGGNMYTTRANGDPPQNRTDVTVVWDPDTGDILATGHVQRSVAIDGRFVYTSVLKVPLFVKAGQKLLLGYWRDPEKKHYVSARNTHYWVVPGHTSYSHSLSPEGTGPSKFVKESPLEGYIIPFSIRYETASGPRVWDGRKWARSLVKVFDGENWVPGEFNVWDGTKWVGAGN